MPVISGGSVVAGSDTIQGRPLKLARAKYDFAVDGGAVGTIGLLPSTMIPSGAVILGGWVKVLTVPTSGGAATIAIQVEAANDIINAAAISGAPWSTTGRKSVIPVFTGATAVETTAARNISAVIGAFALTAGVFEVYLLYVET